MKLSTFTLGALLASAVGAGAQTATKDSLRPDTLKKSKTPATQITEKYHESKILEETKKPSGKDPKRRYCPTCGRG